MCLELCPVVKEKTFVTSYQPLSALMLVEQSTKKDESSSGQVRVWFADQPEAPRGGSWMRSIGVLHNVGAVSLYSLLEPDIQVPKKYFLSPRACLGILKRAARRMKVLPQILNEVLRLQAGLQLEDPLP
jgi:hypothetical protein